MTQPFDTDKTFWQHSRWCFVGDAPEGSRVHTHVDAIDAANAGPSLVFLQGCWGIGKSSAMIHALATHSQGSLLPDKIVWIEDSRIELMHTDGPSHWRSKPVSFTDLRDNVLPLIRNSPLLIVCKVDTREYSVNGRKKRKTARLIEDLLRGMKDINKWYFCVEYFQIDPADRRLIEAAINPSGAKYLRLEGLKDDETRQLIYGRSSHLCKDCYIQGCGFDPPSFFDGKNDEILFQEIQHWAGQHPYALQLVCYALDNYSRTRKKYTDSESAEKYVEEAVGQVHAEQNPIAKFIDSINLDIGNRINTFLSLSSLERQVVSSTTNPDIIVLRHAGIIWSDEGRWELIKLFKEDFELRYLLKRLVDSNDPEIERLCADFALDCDRPVRIENLLSCCRARPQETKRLLEKFKPTNLNHGGSKMDNLIDALASVIDLLRHNAENVLRERWEKRNGQTPTPPVFQDSQADHQQFKQTLAQQSFQFGKAFINSEGESILISVEHIQHLKDTMITAQETRDMYVQQDAKALAATVHVEVQQQIRDSQKHFDAAAAELADILVYLFSQKK